MGALWDEADVVLAIGTDFDGTNTQNWQMPAPPALISVNVDEADANKSYASDVTLVGDARAVLELLVPRVEARDGLAELERRLAAIGIGGDRLGRAATTSRPPVARDRPPGAPARDGASSPTCASRATGSRATGSRRGRASSRYPLGWGTLGFGFPASLGAGLAGAGPTVCVVGDGGFMYACGELATAVQERIPLTIVLVDDGGYGMLRFDQVLSGEEPFGVDLVQTGLSPRSRRRSGCRRRRSTASAPSSSRS